MDGLRESYDLVVDKKRYWRYREIPGERSLDSSRLRARPYWKKGQRGWGVLLILSAVVR